MKILYVAKERSDAQMAATALRGLAPEVTVLWASRFAQAVSWIQGNRDVGALLVEPDVNRQDCPAFLRHVRGLGLTTPVVLVIPDRTAAPLDSLNAGADDVVAKTPSLLQDMPVVVTRAIDRAQAQLDERRAEAIEREAAVKRRLHEFETSFHQREQGWAVEQAAAVERQAALEALVYQERAARAHLEREFETARAAVQEAQQQRLLAVAAAEEQLADRQAQYETSMARAAATWEMVDEQLREAAKEVERARQSQASAAAAADRLTRRESELSLLLAEAGVSQSRLRDRIGEVETALAAAVEQTAHERLASTRQAAERETQFQSQLEQEVETRRRAEDALARVEKSRDEAEQRHAATMTSSAALFEERQARLGAELSDAVAARDALGQQARELEAALDRARQDLDAQGAAVDRLTHREAELASLLAEATTARHTLERRLTGTENAFNDADARATRERLAAAKKAAEREAELDSLVNQERASRADAERQLAQMEAALGDVRKREALAETERLETAAARDSLIGHLQDAQAALEAARRDHASAGSEVERLAQRELELASGLADAMAARAAVQLQLTETRAAMKDASERAIAERDASARTAAEREGELDRALGDERTLRASLERRLADAEVALRDAGEQLASALSAAAAVSAERRAAFEAELWTTAEARDLLRQQLCQSETALESARTDSARLAAELERAAQRGARLASELADAAAAREALERRLTDAAAAIKDADQRARRERTQATERQVEVETLLAEEIRKRETLESEMAEAHSAAADAERWFREETSAVALRAHEHAARLEDQIARERLDQESRLTETRRELRQLAQERDALHESLAAMNAQSERLDLEHREACQRRDRARLEAEADTQKVAALLTAAERQLDAARSDFQLASERAANERASEMASMAATIADRDATIEEATTRHLAALRAAEAERLQLQAAFEEMVTARHQELEQLRHTLETTIEELDATRAHRDVLQTEADRVPRIQAIVDESRAELRRQFEHSPLAMCRCTRNGALTQANRAFAVLAGFRTADDVRPDFAATVFESPDDLSWLIERCLSTRGRESVETTWKRTNGTHVVVRLSAYATASDVIEIVGEDLTNLRALQDRLGQAHRLEAVGRLASEVAVTCNNLLKAIHQDALQWLSTAGESAVFRHQGQMLLDELSRAASFLRQLAAYGDEQTSALSPVDLNRVVRDLEPVLKRVAGDDVEIELPKTSSPLDVDVKAERVERLLVNLASFGRERMPAGGRLRIELGTAVVDGRFVAKYPNVRRGPHALLTVTEVRRGPRPDIHQLVASGPPDSGDPFASGKPGVDLAPLQALIRECGGHLWMTVDPPGDMVVQIHLPLRSADEGASGHTSVIPGSRGRAMARGSQS